MPFNFQASEAKRENVYVKVFLTGTSGSGKSYSALRLATGMANEIEKIRGHRPRIIMLNTEGSRGVYYADEFSYKIWPDKNTKIKPEQFTIDLYVDWIKFNCENEKNHDVEPILIIDGATPAWDATKAAHAKVGGQWKDWSKIDPAWKEFCQTIVQSRAHVICCARGKSQYVVDSENGKQVVRKMGVGADMRDGFDFEFTCSFNIDQANHAAAVDKDNTHIFDGRVLDKALTEEDGVMMIQWANSDAGINSQEITNAVAANKDDYEVQASGTDEEKSLKEYIADIKEIVDNIMSNCSDGDKKSLRSIVSNTIKQYVTSNGKPVADYRFIKDIKTAKDVIKALNNIGEGEGE